MVKITRQKGGYLTQSYDKSPFTNRNVKGAKWQHKQRKKSSIKQQLRTDLGRVNILILTERNAHVKYENPISSGLKVMVNVIKFMMGGQTETNEI